MEWDDIGVQRDDFNPTRLCAFLRQEAGRYGALVTFTGLVRELLDGPLEALELEHYPGMTEKALAAIVAHARARWSLGPVVVRHRVGRLEPGENIVFVGVASAHRQDAFAAAQLIMDYLKRDAPFWKKEVLPGAQRWVEQKASDLSAAEAWSRADGE